MVEVHVTADNIENKAEHKVAKSPIYNPIDGMLYYVDITGFMVCQLNPETNELKRFQLGQGEYVGGVAAMPDGSLYVVTQSGVWGFKPSNEHTSQWAKVTDFDFKSLGVRPNDITIIPSVLDPQGGIDDGATIVIGTAALNVAECEKSGQRPARIYALENKGTEGCKLKELSIPNAQTEGFMFANALCGYIAADGSRMIRFSDSHASCKTLYEAQFLPSSGYLLDARVVKVYEGGDRGRPDGAAIVVVDGQMCQAISAIGAGKFEILAIGGSEKLLGNMVMDSVVKPTKPCFYPNSKGGTSYLITSMPNDAGTDHGGHIFTGDLPANFKAVQQALPGQYPNFEQLVAAGNNVNQAPGLKQLS